MTHGLTAPELSIDLEAVRYNWSRLGSIAAGREVAAMVKADGYGLGMEHVSRALWTEGCREFYVADIDEAISLRGVLPQASIHVLAGAVEGTVPELIEHRLVPVLISLDQIDRWRKATVDEERPVTACVHFDTGMNRTGLDPDETRLVLDEPSLLEGIQIIEVMSHLASADEPGSPKNQAQLQAFRSIRARLPHGQASLANTAGIALGAEFHLDRVRPGIGLCGADPTPNQSMGLRPVVTLKAPVLQVRTVQSGADIGYSATHTTTSRRKVVTIGVGYGDGYHRSLSNQGSVAVDGQIAPIVGRVSMDLITADVTDLPANIEIEAGTPVELIGPNVTLDDVAAAAGTITYEVLTGLGHRYRRVHRA